MARKGKEKSYKELTKSLTEKDKVLILCCYELYDGNWQLLIEDLKRRLEGRPYILKLGERIAEDIERATRLMKLEEEYKIKLSDLITLHSEREQKKDEDKEIKKGTRE